MAVSVSPTGDWGASRTEVHVEADGTYPDPDDDISDAARVPFGQERYFGMSIRVPQDFAFNFRNDKFGDYFIVSQWWQRSPQRVDRDGDGRAETITIIGNPPLELGLHATGGAGTAADPGTGVALGLGGGYNTVAEPGRRLSLPGVDVPLQKGQWYDVVVHYRFSSVNPDLTLNPDGFYELFLRPSGGGAYARIGGSAGRQVGIYDGQAGGSTDSRDGANRNFGTSHRFGIYRGESQTPVTNTVHFDDFRSGFTWSDVDPQANASLPAGWGDRAVGGTGGATVPSGTGGFAVTGVGADIWGTADSFRYASRAVSGDGEIVARVGGQQATDPYAKAGLMIRGNPADADDKFAGVFLTPDNGVIVYSRAETGANAANNGSVAGVSGPVWLRLVRSGASFTGYYSTAGATGPWQRVGGATVSITGTDQAGLAVTPHRADGTPGSATFGDVAVLGFATGSEPTGTLRLEAEGFAGDRGPVGSGAWEVGAGGAYVEVPNAAVNGANGGRDQWDSVGTHTPILRREFTASGGTYDLWSQADARGNGADDSFWVRVNGGAWRLVTVNAASGFAARDSTLDVTLARGRNVIEVAQREDGLRLDWLELRRQTTRFIPSGPAPQTHRRPERARLTEAYLLG